MTCEYANEGSTHDSEVAHAMLLGFCGVSGSELRRLMDPTVPAPVAIFCQAPEYESPEVGHKEGKL